MSKAYRFFGSGIGVLVLATAIAGSTRAADLRSELLAGYAGGPGGQINLTAYHFVENSQLGIRFGMGYAILSPGDAIMARRIFINNADNGTPEKAGHAFTWRMDFLGPTASHNGVGWSLYGGPRYSRFTANFAYVGGNEDFDVRAHQWGLGGGADYCAPINDEVSLRLSGGADYYFRSTLEGHTTSYSPDNDNVNPHEDYKYADAAAAINQPGLQLRCLAGVQFRLGAH